MSDWSEFIPPGVDVPTEDSVVELAGKWKHGWIPLDPTAVSVKMKGNTGGKRWWGKGGGHGGGGLADMHATMSKQKPETTAQIMKRTKGMRKGGDSFMNNPSEKEYQRAIGNDRGTHFRGTKSERTVARTRYESSKPKSIPAQNGQTWKLRGDGKYTLHDKQGNEIKMGAAGAAGPVVSTREQIAKSKRTNLPVHTTGKGESPEARKVSAKNLLQSRLARRDGNTPPPTSGQRKVTSENTKRYLTERHASIMSSTGPLDREHQDKLRVLKAQKRSSSSGFSARDEQQLQHLEARRKQHGRHEYRNGKKTGRIVGGSKGKA